MSITVMKQALEALVKTLKILADANERGVITDTLWFSEYETLFDYIESEITSLRQAIAEAEKQEPVAWYDSESGWTDFHSFKPARKPSSPSAKWLPLYAHPQPKRNVASPREWVGLTDEERHEIREWQKIQEELGPVWAPMMLYLYEAIEAKLKEKNT